MSDYSGNRIRTRSTAPDTVTLFHPNSPDLSITIKPGLLRRLGLRTSAFATLSETYGAHTRNAA